MIKCANCKNQYEEVLLRCPHCGSIPSEKNEQTITEEQIEVISKQVKKEIYKSILFWLGIISLIFGIGLWQIYRSSLIEIQKIIVHRISQEFKSPKIHQTVQDVASSSAEKIIKKEIEPAVAAFETELETNTRDLKKSVQSAQEKLERIELDLSNLSQKTLESIEELENRPNFHQEMSNMLTGIPATVFRDYHKALDYYDEKDYQKTVELIQQVVSEYEKGIPYNLEEYSDKAHDKSASEFYLLASKSNQRLNNNDAAYKYAIKANKINQTHYSYYAVAVAAYNLKKYQESLDFINKALALNPPKDLISIYNGIKDKSEYHINNTN